ncbi:MAG: excinuclease ABC subunit UvrC, partial [Oscillospiraceae bacterium]
MVTQSEFEALVLECSQIKQHKPKYNILLKDDKGYSYVKISREAYPRITAQLQKGDDDSEYIGPFTSSYAVREMVEMAVTCFKLPTCNRRFPQDFKKARPCLNAHIGKCMALCQGKISQSEYNEYVEGAKHLIKQGKTEIIKMLQAKMAEASEKLDFEKAAVLRDQIVAIEKVEKGQKVVVTGELSQDVIAVAAGGGAVCVAVLRFREGRLADKREFIFHDTQDIDEVRNEFLPRYYFDEISQSPIFEAVPKVIAVDKLPDEADILEQLLTTEKKIKVKIYTPERGDTAKLVQMAYLNAMDRLAREKGRYAKEERLLEEMAGLLGLKNAPKTIESYDISNWGDATSVAGMVVFENGKPKR